MNEGRPKEVKEREARATEGPWRPGHHRGFGEEHDVDGPEGRALFGERGMFYRKADAEFVAHARGDVPWLVESLEEALAELEGLRRRRTARPGVRALDRSRGRPGKEEHPGRRRVRPAA